MDSVIELIGNTPLVRLNKVTEGIVPKRSFLNGMYPLYNFPGNQAGVQLRP